MISRLIKYTLNGYLFERIACELKTLLYNLRYRTEGKGKIVITRSFLKLNIKKEAGAKIKLDGNLILTSHCNGRGRVTIQSGENSILWVKHNFSLGQNNKIHVSPNGLLTIGGAEKELVSGISCDSMIMCFKQITIGTDLICGWNTYITDSDWHTTYENGIKQQHNRDVHIGNHCWIGSNVIIGKGTTLSDSIVVGAYTKLSKVKINSGITVVGMPHKELSKNIVWEREI